MYRIVLVDDEQVIRDGLKQLIDWDEHGISIAGEAADGREALRAVERLRPELLLTDIRMPVMDGLDLIRAVREKRQDIKIVVVSGYGEFRLVKESLKYGVENYIVKPVDRDELSATLVSAIEKIESEAEARRGIRENEDVIRDSILYRLIAGRIGRRELEEKLPLLGMSGRENAFTAAIIKAPGAGGGPAGFSPEQRLDIARSLSASLPGHIRADLLQDMAGDTIALFSSAAGELRLGDVETALAECLTGKGMSARAAVGDVVSSLHQVYASYSAAKELTQRYVVWPGNAVLTCETARSEHRKRREVCGADLDRIATLIDGGDAAEIARFFDDLRSQLSRAGGVTVEHVRALTVEAVFCFLQVIKAQFPEPDELRDAFEKRFAGMLAQQSLESLTGAMRGIALELAERLSAQRRKPKALVDRVLGYVRENYDRKDMSLKTLSARFNFTAPYLGQLLKKKTGEIFSDYLNGMRMEKAKELLSGTAMKVNAIAEQVGYADPNYFYRAFKKNVGVYPTEYKASTGRKNNN